MLDFFRVPLELGDTVAFITRHYRDFTRGTVIAFTAKQVRVEYLNQYGKTETTLRYPAALITKGDVTCSLP